jgi:Zn-dependent protease
MDIIQIVFIIIILIMSVVIHEISHGYAAYIQGDPTAKLQGRLTLNPLKHLDLMGSFIVPLLTYFLTGIPLGWAKPVPYNPYNLKNRRWGEAIVALAGPASNLLIAVIFGLVVRFGLNTFDVAFLQLTSIVVYINIGLAIFNLIPIPPLDGSKILFSLIPFRFQGFRAQYERYSLIILVIFIFFLSQYLVPVVSFLYYHLI